MLMMVLAVTICGNNHYERPHLGEFALEHVVRFRFETDTDFAGALIEPFSRCEEERNSGLSHVIK